MSQKSIMRNSNLFLITYDDGNSTQTIKIPEEFYHKDPEVYAKNIIVMKCLSCNFESSFDCVEKENEN